MSKKIDRTILRCPQCKSTDLSYNDNDVVCNDCKQIYSIQNGVCVFNKMDLSGIINKVDRIKFRFKKYPRLYDFLVKVTSPVYFDNQINNFLRKFVNNQEIVAVNFGSGNSNLSPNMTNADIFAYNNVDLVCDISNIPICNDSVDVILNIAVLGHVPEPEKVVTEFYRILKPGGRILCHFPFIAGFHASPFDLTRRTDVGMKVLFKDFQVNSIKAAGGPTSGMLWILQEWLSTVFSFGSVKLQQFLCPFFMLLTFPIKYLDIILNKYPTARNISSGFIIIASKND